jgi:hypothetical protein
MSTKDDLRAQIADDLARSDLTTQIETAIKHAVRSYETDRFWFNEVTGSTVTLSTSVAMIDLATLVPTWFKFDRIRRMLSANNYVDLIPRDYAYIMASQDTALLTTPLEYCIYGNAIQFDCRAAADYTLVLDGVRRISTASASTDATAWFNEGVDLIRARTKKDLGLHVIMDADLTTAMDAAERLAYSTLKGRTNRLKSSGVIRASDF